MNNKINSLEDLKDDIINEVEEIDNAEKITSPENILEFKEIIKDISNNYNVLALKDHVQHEYSSRFAHCEEVAFYTYLICKKFNLDYISAARGAMLHDFYFYNWRNKNVEGQKKFHLLRHPKIALNNALDIFDLNDMERDIIIKHMWPVTVIPPKYVEGFIVTFVDKYCATKEFFKFIKYNNKIKLLSSSDKKDE